MTTKRLTLKHLRKLAEAYLDCNIGARAELERALGRESTCWWCGGNGLDRETERVCECEACGCFRTKSRTCRVCGGGGTCLAPSLDAPCQHPERDGRHRVRYDRGGCGRVCFDCGARGGAPKK